MEIIETQFITWGFLALAIVLAFADVRQQQRLWYWPFIAAIGSALYFEQLTFKGLACFGIGVALALLSKRAPKVWGRILCCSLLCLWLIALAAHLLPGFNNFLLLNNVRASELSIEYSMYLNIDKPLIFFILLLSVPTLMKSDHHQDRTLTFMPINGGAKGYQNHWQHVVKIAMMVVLVVAIFGIAYGLGLIKPDVKVPEWWMFFAFSNLLLTCVAEEAFFRGFVQQTLVKKYGVTVALAATSILFGVAHFSGGFAYVCVATLAGLLYGLAHYWYRSLLMPVLLHFIVNMLHLLLFTYPLAI
ncbi:CPBP family intramembrane glutamic endopeptidase [Thalassotalea fusca]